MLLCQVKQSDRALAALRQVRLYEASGLDKLKLFLSWGIDAGQIQAKSWVFKEYADICYVVFQFAKPEAVIKLVFSKHVGIWEENVPILSCATSKETETVKLDRHRGWKFQETLTCFCLALVPDLLTRTSCESFNKYRLERLVYLEKDVYQVDAVTWLGRLPHMDDVATCGQSHEMILCHVLGRCNGGWDKGVSVAEHFQDKWLHATFAAGGIFIDVSWVFWGYLDYRAEQMIRSFDRNHKISTLVNYIENVLRRFYFIIAVIGGHHLPVFPLVANIFVWQDHCIILVVNFLLQIGTPLLL